MTRLLFTADGLLRERTRGAEARVLSRIAEDREGSAARLVSGALEREIVPFGRTGWAFELRDGDGASSGGFQPFRLRRGGRLRVDEVGMSLHGRPWRHDGWAFAIPDGRKVEAIVARPAEPLGDDGGAGGDSSSGSPTPPAIVLESAKPLELELAEVLALGCWLIARWHMTPPVDHLLVSPPAGSGLESRSAKAATAGILAQPAN